MISLPKLVVRKINDPLIGSETTVIYLKNDEWKAEDTGTVDDENNQWKLFLEFLDNFFKTNPSENES